MTWLRKEYSAWKEPGSRPSNLERILKLFLSEVRKSEYQ